MLPFGFGRQGMKAFSSFGRCSGNSAARLGVPSRAADFPSEPLASALRTCADIITALVRTRLRTAQIERHVAIVDALLVAGLAPEPLLAGPRGLRLEIEERTVTILDPVQIACLVAS